MKKYLLDTNICIFFMRGKFGIDDALRKVGVENCYLSEISVAELLHGAYHSGKLTNVEITKNFISFFTILPITDCLETFAVQKSKLQEKGTIIENFDLLIGTTAIANNMIMVTDNGKHLSRLDGIEIENWIERQ